MINYLLAELKRRSAPLYWFGFANVLLLVLGLIMFFIDDTVIKGINAWIKPMKFAISVTIYSFTFAWLMAYITGERARKIIVRGLIICMTVENSLIFIQAFRGTSSHFNIHTPLDGAIFGIMGLFIAVNSVLILFALIVLFRKGIPLDPLYLNAWRFGLVFFFLGGISGGWMSTILTHTVGAADGGPGLPFLNWSTVAGDIRAAHFVTLHGLQAIPLAAWVLSRVSLRPSAWLNLFVVSYTLLCVELHWLALKGLPLVPAL